MEHRSEEVSFSDLQRTGSKEGEADEAASFLYRRYHRLIYYFIGIFDLPPDSHDDLFNQIFIRIIKGLRNIKHFENLKSWVVTITKNEIYSFIQKRRKEERLLGTSPACSMTGRGTFHKTSVPPQERELLTKELRESFKDCLATIVPSHREPFILRYIDGLPWKQIGAKLNVKIDTARKRSNRARSKILRVIKRRFGKNTM